MKRIDNKKFIIISLVLFSMFFGAGNFIFPPVLGKESGILFYETIIYFCLTAVVLPIFGIAAIAKNGSVNSLSCRVGKYFGPIFIILIYLAIGPFIAIPRASNLPFEVSISIFTRNKEIALIFWSIGFFIINYLICINRSKVVDILGKWLTPTLLILVATLVVGVCLSGMHVSGQPIGKYAIAPKSTAFLEGYSTMDAMAFVLAIIVINFFKQLGLTSRREIARVTIKAGIFSGILLSMVYVSLAYLGAATVSVIGQTTNGAEILSKTAHYLFGTCGQLILGMALFLACITTTVGLTTSGSQHFSEMFPKINYKKWCLIFCIISVFMANIGLDGILKLSVPILNVVYPVVIVLILLGLINNFIEGSKLIYTACVYVALFSGLFYSLGTVEGLLPESSVNFIKNIIPFYDYGLGWTLLTFITFCITFVIHITVNKK